MEKEQIVIAAESADDAIRFTIESNDIASLGTPAGKMLTDTERHSFVYLFDDESGYRRVYFPSDCWGSLAELLETDKEPVLAAAEGEVVLDGAKDELLALVYNIEGNHNYGKAFSEAVEQAFRSVLEQS